MGASSCTNDSGTNSVKPPVSFWISRKSSRWRSRCKSLSTCPYISVEVVGSPSECALLMTPTHSAVVMRPGAIRWRNSSSSTSADVPGSVSSPASRSSMRNSCTEIPRSSAPNFTSSGENACKCNSGAAFFSARTRSA